MARYLSIRIVDRYLAGYLLSGITVTMLVLLAVSFFLGLSGEISDVGKANFKISTAVIYTLSSLPSLAYELFPLASLIGGLYALGHLASGSELIVMRSAGLSVGRLILSVQLPGVIILVIMLLLAEWLVPFSEKSGESLRNEALMKVAYDITKSGIWLKDDRDFIRIKSSEEPGQLEQVEVFQFSKSRAPKQLEFIDEVRYLDYLESNDSWSAAGINEIQFLDQKILSNQRDTDILSRGLKPEHISLLAFEPEHLNSFKLYQYIKFLQSKDQETARYEQVLWGRIAQPAAVLVMLALAVPFVMRSARAVPVGQRIFIGVIVGVIFYLLNAAMKNIAFIYDWSPLIGAIAIPLLFFFLAMLLVRWNT
jgi:lipopolysaccharide export system permease protein